MQTVFDGKRISGMLCVLPESIVTFEEETGNFSDSRMRRLKQIMGYKQRRRAKSDTTMADMCIYGLKHLLESGKVQKEEIGAVIVVTISPDYFSPAVSNIIHGECELPQDVMCVDIPQACAGFIYGLNEAFMLLEHMGNKKALVFNGGVSARLSEEEELFQEPPTGGDAMTITIVENDKQAERVFCEIRNDGRLRDCLVVSKGGFKNPSDSEKAAHGKMMMDGSRVFQFVQREVPILVDSILQLAGKEKEQIDWFLFHQPNRFMLEKLADKMEVPREKMFMNIVENFGNSSGAAVVVNIIYNLQEQLLENAYECCISGFGSGVSWGAMVMKLGMLDFCDILESDL